MSTTAALLDVNGPTLSRKERATKTVNAALRGGVLAGAGRSAAACAGSSFFENMLSSW